MSPIAAAYRDHRAAAVLEVVAPEHHYRAAAVLEVVAPAPRHRFEERINALVGMGLLDRARNLQALELFQGDMQAAIHLLLAADAD